MVLYYQGKRKSPQSTDGYGGYLRSSLLPNNRKGLVRWLSKLSRKIRLNGLKRPSHQNLWWKEASPMETVECSFKSSAESHSADRKVWSSGDDMRGVTVLPVALDPPKRSVWLNNTEREANSWMSQIFSCACTDSGLQMNTYRICVYIDTLDKAGGYDVHVRYSKGFSGSYLICERNESYVHLKIWVSQIR